MQTNFFAGSTLYRNSEKRTNVEYLRAAIRNEETRYVLFQNSNPLVEDKNGEYSLISFAFKDVNTIYELDGITQNEERFQWPEFLLYLGKDSRGVDWLAINIEKEDPAMNCYLDKPNRLVPVGFVQSLLISWEDSSIVAQAKSMFQWLDRYRFCPTCGKRMRIDEAGYKRTCIDDQCRSNKGVHNTCYPRTDPTAIMCVISKDGSQCLLGRKSGWPKKMYSCLAGFMEPGENIEETVRRETKEESGVIVENVQYISSQPWPFPSSLMIGCLATASTEEICVNKEEMEDVRWFTKESIEQALHHKSDMLRLPAKQAIAHQLVKHWLSTLEKETKSSL